MTVGLKDLVISPSHAMLTIHEIVAHPTELDRIVGYEANYAGTSFISLADVGKLTVGSKLFNITADRTLPGGMCTVGYDDDGVKSQQWPLVREAGWSTCNQPRDGALPEARLLAWLHLRHLMAQFTIPADAQRAPRRRPARSPTPMQIIADTKDGVLIEGRGSYSIDQQRYNGSSAATPSGNQGRQEDQDRQRRHLQRDHHRLLEQPGRDFGPGVVGDVRHHR